MLSSCQETSVLEYTSCFALHLSWFVQLVVQQPLRNREASWNTAGHLLLMDDLMIDSCYTKLSRATERHVSVDTENIHLQYVVNRGQQHTKHVRQLRHRHLAIVLLRSWWGCRIQQHARCEHTCARGNRPCVVRRLFPRRRATMGSNRRCMANETIQIGPSGRSQ